MNYLLNWPSDLRKSGGLRSVEHHILLLPALTSQAHTFVDSCVIIMPMTLVMIVNMDSCLAT